MRFERGKDPKEALKIGAIEHAKREIQKMGGLVLTPDDMYDTIDPNYPVINGVKTGRMIKGGQQRMYETTIAVLFEDDGTYTVLKNRWGSPGGGEVKDLPPLVKEWKERHDKFYEYQKNGNYEI